VTEVAPPHRFDGVDQQVFGQRNSGFGREVHGDFQLLHLFSLTHCLEELGCVGEKPG
jgi:hypothetical protein